MFPVRESTPLSHASSTQDRVLAFPPGDSSRAAPAKKDAFYRSRAPLRVLRIQSGAEANVSPGTTSYYNSNTLRARYDTNTPKSSIMPKIVPVPPSLQLAVLAPKNVNNAPFAKFSVK